MKNLSFMEQTRGRSCRSGTAVECDPGNKLRGTTAPLFGSEEPSLPPEVQPPALNRDASKKSSEPGLWKVTLIFLASAVPLQLPEAADQLVTLSFRIPRQQLKGAEEG